eukprot:3149500-Pyramimonas_sp.AAC.1
MLTPMLAIAIFGLPRGPRCARPPTLTFNNLGARGSDKSLRLTSMTVVPHGGSSLGCPSPTHGTS